MPCLYAKRLCVFVYDNCVALDFTVHCWLLTRRSQTDLHINRYNDTCTARLFLVSRFSICAAAAAAIAFDWSLPLCTCTGFRYSHQLIARRKCGAINCVKKNRNEFCLPNVTHDRLSLGSYTFSFSQYFRRCADRPTDRQTHTHTHGVFAIFASTFLESISWCGPHALRDFAFFFSFFALSRSRDIFLYSQFVSLYLFSGHTLGNHNASINRRIELKLLAGFTQINWQFCMSKRSSPWAMSNAVCAFIFLCSSHRRTHFRCSKRIFVYFRHAIRLENTFGSCVCPQCIGVSSWSYKMYTLAVKIRYSPLRECAHWQPFGFSCRIDTKTKRKNGFSFGWMRFEGTNRIQGIYFAFQLHWRGPSIKIW